MFSRAAHARLTVLSTHPICAPTTGRTHAQLTCCADCIHLILDARSDEQLRELVKTSPNEHVRRCAAGALCNIRASPQYAARLAAEARAEERRRAAAPRGTETAASRGHSTRKWSPRSEQSLQNALAARVKADALHFAARRRAAVTIQAASRRRLGVRAAHALRWRERSSDAAFFDGEDTGADVLPDDMEAELASIGARLREAYDASSEVKAAISELAHLLSEVADEHCIALIRSLARLDVVRLLVRLLSMIDLVAHSHLAHIGLSALVNVADIGGALLVKRDGGLDLLLALMRSPTESFVFLATAGVQNVLSTPQMANDADCMQKLVRCGAEATLQQLAGHANPSISRSATGALANLAQSSAHKVLKSALYVTEHYKSQAELEVRAQLRSHSSSGIGSGKSSPRSNTADLRNSFVYELV